MKADYTRTHAWSGRTGRDEGEITLQNAHGRRSAPPPPPVSERLILARGILRPHSCRGGFKEESERARALSLPRERSDRKKGKRKRTSFPKNRERERERENVWLRIGQRGARSRLRNSKQCHCDPVRQKEHGPGTCVTSTVPKYIYIYIFGGATASLLRSARIDGGGGTHRAYRPFR